MRSKRLELNLSRTGQGVLAACFILVGTAIPFAQETVDPELLTLDRIFSSEELSLERFGPARWLEDGSGYTILEELKGEKGQGVVKYEVSSGKREVLVSSRRLVPPGQSTPLTIDDYQWSGDGSLLLIYTNSQRVWRQKTRGDYWILDLTSYELIQLGGDTSNSTLMFAKFSPDARQVAYVRQNNLYVEDFRSGEITALTEDGSKFIINGTSDWVYEEELGVRDAFRWSPDGKSIAFWQFDTKGVRDFYLINNTDSLYPKIIPIQYPKVGERNSACRIGVVSYSGGKVRWVQVPGDPRNHYIARMDWAASSEELVIQQLNRLQNTLKIMLADVDSGQVRTILTERDEAWVDVHRDLHWLDEGNEFTWVSERDGWRHIYIGSRHGGEPRLLTVGDYDTGRSLGIQGIDENNGWVYFMASPDNPTQRYLYRVSLEGGKAKLVTPGEQKGTHSYQISSDSRWAFHSYSSFDLPPVTELVSLPDHKKIRTLGNNTDLRRKVEALKRTPTEFFRIDIGEGVELDAWIMKPPDFDSSRRYPLLVHVYGEPAGQTVLDRWGGNRYLWHLMLAQRGYLVLSVDNRGTPAPRGRAWRKIIYRQIGILASADQAAAIRSLLEKRSYVDANRVGVWGWSGGGSMSSERYFPISGTLPYGYFRCTSK